MRTVVALATVCSLSVLGCPDDKCAGNKDCIDGYSCNPAGDCVETDPLQIINDSSLKAVVGELLQEEMLASGGIAPYKWTLDSDETWLSIQSSTGLLSGTPPAISTGTAVTVRATDGSYDGRTASKDFVLVVTHCYSAQENSCSGHGDCQEDGSCNCMTGYSGEQCEECGQGYHLTDSDECLENEICPNENPCSGHGVCDDSSGEITCDCNLGYEGDLCEECASGYHDENGECVPNPTCIENICSGHGECDDSTGEIVCTCEPEYDGEYCDECVWVSCLEQQRLIATETEAGDLFGLSISIDGDYAVVGSGSHDNDKGAIWIFHRSSSSAWSLGSKHCHNSAQEGDRIGSTVSISGDLIAARGADIGIHTFRRVSPDLWIDAAHIESPAPGMLFGAYMSIDGDYLIANAPHASQDRVFIYRQTAENEWDGGTVLECPDPSEVSDFGDSVDISGDYAAVGCSTCDNLVGAVYVFHRTGPNEWNDVVKLTPPDQVGGGFGYDVATDGQYVIGGAYTYSGVGVNSGSAYIFHRIGINTWDSGTIVVAPDTRPYDHFGRSVSINNGTAVVGTEFNAETAYAYRLEGENTWSEGTKLFAPDGLPDDKFGNQVDNYHHIVIVSAPHDGNEFGSDAGSVYAY